MVLTTRATNENAPRAPRRWFRLSLRAALLVMIVAGVLLAYVASRNRQIRQAITTIEQAGGDLTYSYQVVGGAYDEDATESSLTQTLRYVGLDFPPQATMCLITEPVDDEVVAAVGKLPTLTLVAISKPTGVTDAGLKHLGGLERLEILRILNNAAGITDDGLTALAGLPSLQMLVISGSAITGQGIDARRHFPSLAHLDLSDSAVDDLGACAISKLPALKDLYLSRTKITNAGLGCISRMQALEQLAIAGVNVSEEGLVQLAELKNLTWLVLDNLTLSDETLRAVGKLTKLTGVTVDPSGFTDDDLQAFQDLKSLEALFIGSNTDDRPAPHLSREAMERWLPTGCDVVTFIAGEESRYRVGTLAPTP